MTKIPWTEKTWNPVVGCTKIAAGCKNCYARRLHDQRHKAYLENKRMPIQYAYPFHRIQLLDDRPSSPQNRLEYPLHWIKPRKIFVNSMSDLFHPKVPFEFQCKVFNIIEKCPQHIFQILTKRPKNMLEFFSGESGAGLNQEPLKNAWLGTSISTQADADKNIPILLQIPAAVRFISLEPMLEEIDLREWIADCGCVRCQKHYFTDLDELILPENDNAKCPECEGEIVSFSGYTNDHEKLHWVIIGCESGPGARLCSIEDIRDAVRQCRAAGVPVFVKQVPVNGKCSKKPEEWPKDLRIQEYPK